jgi:hypothetical protein
MSNEQPKKYPKIRKFSARSRRLEDVRQKLGLTVSDFHAALMEVAGDVPTYAAAATYHAGRTPSVDYLLAVSRRFGYRLEWLADGEEPSTTALFVEGVRRSAIEADRKAKGQPASRSIPIDVKDPPEVQREKIIRNIFPHFGTLGHWAQAAVIEAAERSHADMITQGAAPNDISALIESAAEVALALADMFDPLLSRFGALAEQKRDAFVVHLCQAIIHAIPSHAERVTLNIMHDAALDRKAAAEIDALSDEERKNLGDQIRAGKQRSRPARKKRGNQ